MTRLTFDDLKPILIECAGEDDQADLDGDILDIPFIDLGYDSLVLLETTAIVAQRFGVTLADDAVAEVETPHQFLDLVNDALPAS